MPRVTTRAVLKGIQVFIGAVCVIISGVRVAAMDDRFHHYTSWNFLLISIYILAEAFSSSREFAVIFLQPVTFATGVFVALASIVMFLRDFGVVRKVFATYNAGIVESANFLIHYLIFIFWLAVTMSQTREHHALFWASRVGTKSIINIGLYWLTICQIVFMITGSYFFVYSPKKMYGIRDVPDSYTVPLAIGIHQLLVVLFAAITTTVAKMKTNKRHLT